VPGGRVLSASSEAEQPRVMKSPPRQHSFHTAPCKFTSHPPNMHIVTSHTCHAHPYSNTTHASLLFQLHSRVKARPKAFRSNVASSSSLPVCHLYLDNNLAHLRLCPFPGSHRVVTSIGTMLAQRTASRFNCVLGATTTTATAASTPGQRQRRWQSAKSQLLQTSL